MENAFCVSFKSIFTDNFLNTNNDIYNLHLSLLPKYKGLNTHRRALKNREKFSGCTVHRVNGKIDSGEIILQSKVKIAKNETEASLENKILKGKGLYLHAASLDFTHPITREKLTISKELPKKFRKIFPNF